MLRVTQTDLILQHLRRRGTITQREADDRYGITRLGARIYDLKHRGFDIRREMVPVMTRYGETTHVAQYYLVQEATQC